jgi:AbrB family looped-hinge helix DNA binding protein
MANIGLTKISSKGQIVIPSELRGDLKEGEQLLIIKDEGRIMLRKIGVLTEKMKEDLEFAKRTEEAWQQIDNGKKLRGI